MHDKQKIVGNYKEITWRFSRKETGRLGPDKGPVYSEAHEFAIVEIGFASTVASSPMLPATGLVPCLILGEDSYLEI
jgi:hypothetical protein